MLNLYFFMSIVYLIAIKHFIFLNATKKFWEHWLEIQLKCWRKMNIDGNYGQNISCMLQFIKKKYIEIKHNFSYLIKF